MLGAKGSEHGMSPGNTEDRSFVVAVVMPMETGKVGRG